MNDLMTISFKDAVKVLLYCKEDFIEKLRQIEKSILLVPHHDQIQPMFQLKVEYYFPKLI